MRSALGDSEIDSILQNVTSADEQSLLKPGRVGVAKKKPPGDQLTSPSKTKAAVTKDTKVLLEETKKVSYLFLSSSTLHGFFGQEIILFYIPFFNSNTVKGNE